MMKYYIVETHPTGSRKVMGVSHDDESKNEIGGVVLHDEMHPNDVGDRWSNRYTYIMDNIESGRYDLHKSNPLRL